MFIRLGCLAFVACVLGFDISQGVAQENSLPADSDPTSLVANAPTVDTIEQTVLRALDQPLYVGIRDLSIEDLPSWIQGALQVSAGLDHKALAESALPLETALNGPVGNTTMRAALNIALDGMDLTWTIRDGVMLITTTVADSTLQTTKLYSITDLVRRGPNGVSDTETLIEMITGTVDAPSWVEVGGIGVIKAISKQGVDTLVVTQRRVVHEQIEQLLTALRAIRGGLPGEPKPAAGKVENQPTEATICRALTQPLNGELNGTLLEDLPALLHHELKITAVLDKRALSNASIDLEQPLKTPTGATTTRVALDFALQQAKLTWTVRDGVLVITTPESEVSHLVVRVYDVASLVNRFRGGPTDYESLMEMITAHVAPSDWSEVGGYGAIRPYECPNVQVLVIAHTRAVHGQVNELLGKLSGALGSSQSIQLPVPSQPVRGGGMF